MQITMKDIARKTGVSVSTVSLVLNKKEHRISPETRQRILDAAEELRYRPNPLAVGLSKRKTKTIGLILPDISNLFFAEIAKGAQMSCQEERYSVILCNTNDNPEKDVEYSNVLLDRGVDGILLVMAGSSTDHKASECFALLQEAQKPIVLVDRYIQGVECPAIVCDNEKGGYLATMHLLALGHRKIGCITGPMGTNSAKQRFYGYIRALQEYGVPFSPDLVKEGDYYTTSGYQLARHLLVQKPTAVFGCNDMMAYGVCQRAQELGLRVPEDLSVVGFDNLFFSQNSLFPLTTVNQPAREMGEAAARALLEQLKTEEAMREDLVFSPELIIRKSTIARLEGEGK